MAPLFPAILALVALSACSTAQNITQQPEEIQQAAPEDTAVPEIPPYELHRDAAIDAVLANMALDAKIAQLIVLEVPPLRDLRELSVDSLRRYLSVYYKRSDFGGFILFGNNIRSRDQLRSLTGALAGLSEVPALVMVDEEGGAVSRVRNAGIAGESLPAPRVVGSFGSASEVRRLGRAVGRDLRSLGITMNLAPVADVSSRGDERSYGQDPRAVAASVVAFAEGLQSESVAAVAKHFPGIGAVSEDPHLGPVYSSASLEELTARELLPFEAAVASGIDGVMTSHVTFSAVCDEGPAGLSPCLVTGLLRERLGFEGVVITDALTMGALEGEGDVALRAVLAGTDLLLGPRNPQATVERLLAAVEEGRLTEQRLDESLRRILRLKIERYVWVPQDPALQERWLRWRGYDDGAN